MAIKSKIRTKEIDRGFDKLIKEFKKLQDKPFIKIGYPAESSKTDAGHDDSEFVTVLDLAIFHEFGTINLPERSFLRASFDNNRRKYEKINKKLMIKILTRKLKVEKALDIIGEIILNDIKTFLNNNEVDPDSLRALSQGGVTLVNTGQLRESLTFVRVDKRK